MLTQQFYNLIIEALNDIVFLLAFQKKAELGCFDLSKKGIE
jgi:hypothetical protein